MDTIRKQSYIHYSSSTDENSVATYINNNRLLPTPLISSRNDSFQIEHIQNGDSFPASSKEHYMLCIVVKGSAVLDQINLYFEPGLVSLFQGSSKFQIQNWSPDFSCYVISFKKNFLHEVLGYEPLIENMTSTDADEPFISRIHGDAQNDLFKLPIRLYDEYHNNYLFRTGMLKALFVELLLKIVRATQHTPIPEISTNSQKKRMVSKFKKLVDKNFMSIRSVSQYASLMFVSSKHLSETVKEFTGTTALHIIHYRICQEAKYWLSTTMLSIKEIAFKLNFDSSSHFSRFFKRFTGSNPTQFQRLNMMW